MIGRVAIAPDGLVRAFVAEEVGPDLRRGSGLLQNFAEHVARLVRGDAGAAEGRRRLVVMPIAKRAARARRVQIQEQSFVPARPDRSGLVEKPEPESSG